MKRTLRIAPFLILCAFAASAQTRGKQVTIVGEVIDIQCYVSGQMGPGKSQEHKECAINCAKGGIPLGILEDKTGTVYVAGQTKTAYASANKLLMDYIAEKVRVTGRVHSKGGVNLLVISDVKRVASK